MTNQLTDAELAEIRKCLQMLEKFEPYVDESIELAKDRQAMSRVKKKIWIWIGGLAATLIALQQISTNLKDWVKAWLT